jgi:hypothetical protein
VIVRILVDGPSDLSAVHAIQDRLVLQGPAIPLSISDAVSALVGWPAYPRRCVYVPERSGSTLVSRCPALPDPPAIAASILPATAAAAAFTGSLARWA